MKKLFSILLAVPLLITGGCASNDGNQPQPFRVGFGRVDITPDYAVHIGSYSNVDTRISEGAADELYATALAMTGPDGNTYVSVVLDLYIGSTIINDDIRPLIEKELGIPQENITIGGIHNHSGPDYNYAAKGNRQFKEDCGRGAVEAVRLALDDRAAAEIFVGTTNTQGLNFVRRYFLANGELTSPSFNTNHNSTIVSHESEADTQIQMVRFVRESAKDIMLVNWQTHVGLHGNTNMLSADFVGPLRTTVEETLDVHSIYYEGAAGNLSYSTKLPGEMMVASGSGWEKAERYGKSVAAYVIDAWNRPGCFSKIASGDVKIKHTKFVGSRTWVEANAITVGELSFVTLPVEFFDSLGVMIKEGSPAAMTMIMGYTCGNGQFLPSEQGFMNGGYESINTQFRKGEGEQFVQFYLEILEEMHK